ncbi:VOC family protein [Kribbella jiaozuonensis]|uniref:VOC family protein n=1 Tax=Kribbella jiaozuonensis TaxID=2575441 RepID=A0A4U3LQQ5_9ACTN|nr:VOC family protein [Kribbella jiaozuonensis]TKK77454.1 VOC family protein [Kribbella jiaozuonensis]
MDIKHRMIVFDAADIEAESAFWAAFLDGTVEKWSERWHAIWVDGGWALGVQLAPDHVPPDWPDGAPQQIHIDLYFEGVDAHTAAHERALALGAWLLKPADDATAARGVQVYADPAGHPFCLCWVPA